MPVVRPHYVVFPKDKAGFDLDDQFFVGSSGLLVKPVTQKSVTETTVYLPEDQVYYDYFTYIAYHGATKGKNVTVPAALSQIPLFIRGGSIIPTRERARRASSLMKFDPFTLRVALDKKGTARGELYLDDGVTYSHQKGELVWREFVAETKQSKTLRISNKDLAALNPTAAVDGAALTRIDSANEFAKSLSDVRVEKIIIVGLGSRPKKVSLVGGSGLTFDFASGVPANGKEDALAGYVTIKDPGVGITKEWVIEIQL
jgi:alpha 1,3-glucosidase